MSGDRETIKHLMILVGKTIIKFCQLHKCSRWNEGLKSVDFCQDTATYSLNHNIRTPKALSQTTCHILAIVFMYLCVK